MIKNFSSPEIEYQLVAESLLCQDKLRAANQNRLIFLSGAPERNRTSI